MNLNPLKLLALFASIIIFSACGKGPDQEPLPRLVKVVVLGQSSEMIQEPGVMKDPGVLRFDASGKVMELLVKSGDSVLPGQSLARIIPNSVSSESSVMISYRAAKAELQSAEADFKRYTDLKNKNSAFSQLIDEQSNSQIGQLYRDIYNREISIADQYRNWALGIFAIVGIILVLGFLNISIQNWNHLKDSSYIHIPLGWESLIKTLMLFSLTTPAWYLARESSKHRKVAYKAQMLGTELASFPLYAREFKDEDRLELRKHLADRFFGQELYNDSKTNSNSDNSIEQIKLLTEANKVLAESLKIKKSIEGG